MVRSPFARAVVLCALAALAVLVAPATAALAADTDAALPVCAPGDYPDAASWYGSPSGAGSSAVMTGQTSFVDGYFVARGLVHGCASQQRATLKKECTTSPSGTSCHWVHDQFVPFSVGSVPQVIDAAGGDEQTVTVTFPDAQEVYWGQCLPRSGLGTIACPDGADNPGHSGTVLFRFRQVNGFFSGRWQASQTAAFSGFVSPGFMLQAEHGACARTATTCRYLVKFTRDTLNQPAILKDVQLLLQFYVGFKNELGENATTEVAVPVLVQQRGGPAQTPDPPSDPAPPPVVPAAPTTGGPTSGAAAGAGTSTADPPGTGTPSTTTARVRVRLKTSRIKVRKHAVPLSLTCGAAACRAKVALRPSATSKISLGSAKLTIPAGKRRTVTIKLNRRGRALLRSKPKAKVRAVVTFTDGTRQTLTLTLRR